MFKNTDITLSDIGDLMFAFAEDHCILSTPRRTLVTSYFSKTILLATPLLQWYLKHGLVVSHIYQVVEYKPKPRFRVFGDSVSDARRQGDLYQDKAFIASRQLGVRQDRDQRRTTPQRLFSKRRSSCPGCKQLSGV